MYLSKFDNILCNSQLLKITKKMPTSFCISLSFASGCNRILHPWEENKYGILTLNIWNKRIIFTNYSVSNLIICYAFNNKEMWNNNRIKLTKDDNQILKRTWNALYKIITVFSWKADLFSIIFGPAFKTNIKYVPTIHNIGPGDPIKSQVSTTGSIIEENIIRLFFTKSQNNKAHKKFLINNICTQYK